MHPAGYSFGIQGVKLKLRSLEEVMPYIHRGEFSQLGLSEHDFSKNSDKLWSKILANSEVDAIDLLGKGKSWVLSNQYVFHKNLVTEVVTYQVYDRAQWNNFWQSLPIVPESKSQTGLCITTDQDLCWSKNSRWDLQAAPLLTMTAGALLSASLIWIVTLYGPVELLQ